MGNQPEILELHLDTDLTLRSKLRAILTNYCQHKAVKNSNFAIPIYADSPASQTCLRLGIFTTV